MASVEIKGIITRIYGRDEFRCTIHDGNRNSEFFSRTFVHPGDSARVSCFEEERFGKKALVAEKIEKAPDMYAEVEGKLMENAQLHPISGFDGTTEKMRGQFEMMARKIYAAQQLGRHIAVKFHGDADGISSALIVRKFLRATYLQQNGAIYSVGDAIRDLEKMNQQFRPLLVLLDFGSGEDSAEGLGLAKAGGLEMISIDHHPPSGFSVPSFALRVNPWDAAGETQDNKPETFDGSRYPTGFLCAKLAEAFGIGSDGLERVACAGDKSSIVEISKEDREKALVLDFVATYSGFGNGIEFYSEVLAKPELFNSILVQAHSKLEEADRLLKTALKSKSVQKAEVYWFNLDTVAEKREFPNRGKVTGRVFEVAGAKGAAVVIGYSKRTLIFRLNDEAVANGLDARRIIEGMKANFSDFVENGGGHARAAALRIKEGFEAAAVEEIIKMLGQQ